MYSASGNKVHLVRMHIPGLLNWNIFKATMRLYLSMRKPALSNVFIWLQSQKLAWKRVNNKLTVIAFASEIDFPARFSYRWVWGAYVQWLNTSPHVTFHRLMTHFLRLAFSIHFAIRSAVDGLWSKSDDHLQLQSWAINNKAIRVQGLGFHHMIPTLGLTWMHCTSLFVDIFLPED